MCGHVWECEKTIENETKQKFQKRCVPYESKQTIQNDQIGRMGTIRQNVILGEKTPKEDSHSKRM